MTPEQWFKEELHSIRNTFDYRLEKILLELGEDLCRFMAEQRLSRTQLADRLGVSCAYITKILNGNPNLSIKSLLKLADALGKELRIQFTPRANVRHRRPHAAGVRLRMKAVKTAL